MGKNSLTIGAAKSLTTSSHPLRTQQFRLHQHRLNRILLKIRRVAVFIQDALHHHLDLRPGAFAESPVDGLAKCECQRPHYEVKSVRHSKLLIRHSSRHQIRCYQCDALRIAHQRLQCAPPRLEFFFFRQPFFGGVFFRLSKYHSRSRAKNSLATSSSSLTFL